MAYDFDLGKVWSTWVANNISYIASLF